MSRGLLPVALALMLVIAGCATILPGYRGDEHPNLGREGGVGATDDIAVTSGDGLNATERDLVVKRTMARVELIRGEEFTENVSVELVSREQYRQQQATATGPTPESRWNDQVWEALFIVNETATFQDAFGGVLSSAVLGFYSNGRIVIVSDSPTPLPDRATLAHELTHAVQDQQLSLGGGEATQDAQLASDGLVEGDANLVESLYEQRCEREWQCIDRPTASGGGGGEFNRGIYLVIIQPYVDGPRFVQALRDRGGWDAVDAAYDDFPTSTEQIIHPEKYPDERPIDVTVADRSDAAWNRFDVEPTADTVGEASIYAMFRYNGIIEGGNRYDYDNPVSAGWGGDTLVPYYRGDPVDGEYGYVWRTQWDTEADAREFLSAYRALLTKQGATADGDVYVVASGPYADAFRVTREGTTVTVVNAPTRDALDGVHAR